MKKEEDQILINSLSPYRTVTAAMLPCRGSPEEEADFFFRATDEAAEADSDEASASSPPPKTLQKRSVSSAAAVATVRPSGLVAM